MNFLFGVIGGLATVLCVMVAIRCIEDVRIQKDD